ncbi:hypothetical protein KP509_07G023000 [Ceratopteris richardii]|uniref:Uncharacterized protein n=1 Tax=Ceratopteris richardii TaxID=49495 RepID=A0A8T2U9B1_CERRI|nr:hypothetical protein KP509_07G023000 [Ceratopteris richardii]
MQMVVSEDVCYHLYDVCAGYKWTTLVAIICMLYADGCLLRRMLSSICCMETNDSCCLIARIFLKEFYLFYATLPAREFSIFLRLQGTAIAIGRRSSALAYSPGL